LRARDGVRGDGAGRAGRLYRGPARGLLAAPERRRELVRPALPAQRPLADALLPGRAAEGPALRQQLRLVKPVYDDLQPHLPEPEQVLSGAAQVFLVVFFGAGFFAGFAAVLSAVLPVVLS